jgi:hypothetical protein
MERGSDKHGAMRDDKLDKELSGMLGQAGGHREDWREPEFVADDADDAAAGDTELLADNDRSEQPR